MANFSKEQSIPPYPGTVFDRNRHRWVKPDRGSTAIGIKHVDSESRELGQAFAKAGHDLFLVGGYVRDSILGREAHDRDFTTDATPEEITKLLREQGYKHISFVGAKFGVITVVRNDGESSEITTYRSEKYSQDSRNPDVKFGTNLKEDLSRRDFTINAMAFNANTGELIDPFEGRKHLQEKKIVAVGNADDRFNEDPLRMMRAVRFAAQLGFSLESPISHPERIAIISTERITSEISKIMLSSNPAKGIKLLVETGLMKHIMPEFMEMVGLKGGSYHMKDAYGHTLDVIEAASKEPAHNRLGLMLAALLHDIGKPKTISEDKGEVHFYNHQHIGAEMAKKILSRMRFDNDTISYAQKLVENHMSMPEEISDRTIRRLILRNGKEPLEDLISLCTADTKSHRQPRLDHLKELRRRIHDYVEKVPDAMPRSPLDGNEIAEALNLKVGRGASGAETGKKIGAIKQKLLDMVVEGQLKPDDKAGALEVVREGLSKSKELPIGHVSRRADGVYVKIGPNEWKKREEALVAKPEKVEDTTSSRTEFRDVRIAADDQYRFVNKLGVEFEASLRGMNKHPDYQKAKWAASLWREVATESSRNPDSLLRVVSSKHGVEGAVVGHPMETDSGQKVWEIDFLTTNPKNIVEINGKIKVRGTGTHLVYISLKDAVQRGSQEIGLTPLYSAVSFYKKLGFHEDRRGSMSLSRSEAMRFISRYEGNSI